MCQECETPFDTAEELRTHVLERHTQGDPVERISVEIVRVRQLLVAILVVLIIILVVLLERLPQEINVTAF